MQFFIKHPKSSYDLRYERMIEIYKDYNEKIYPDNLVDESKTYYELLAYWDSQRNNNIHTYFFISDREIIYGACKFDISKNKEAALALGVVPSKRNQGYGTMFVQLCKIKAKELGIKEIILETDSKNEQLIRFYEKCGAIFKKSHYPENGKRIMYYSLYIF